MSNFRARTEDGLSMTQVAFVHHIVHTILYASFRIGYLTNRIRVAPITAWRQIKTKMTRVHQTTNH